MSRPVRIVAIVILCAVPIFAFAQRAVVTSRLQVVMGGSAVAAQRFEGGDAVAEVVGEKGGPDAALLRRIGSVSYETIAFDVGLDSFRDTVQATLAGRSTRLNGSLDEADFDGDIVRSRTFENALITEIGFPALDAGSKNVAYLSLRLSPEAVRTQKAGGGIKAAPSVKQRPFVSSNFRVELQGLDCSRVSKVDAIVIKQTAARERGDRRDARLATALELPNLRMTVSGPTADALLAWHEDFVVRGMNDASKEKTGSIVFLNAARDVEILRLELGGVGIFAMRREPAETNSDRIRHFVAEMYVESIRVR